MTVVFPAIGVTEPILAWVIGKAIQVGPMSLWVGDFWVNEIQDPFVAPAQWLFVESVS